MPGITLEDGTTRALRAALDGLSTRQAVIGNNLANIDTPGFKASEVSFAGELQRALETRSAVQMVSTDARHMAGRPEPGPGFTIVTRSDTSRRMDGNNVDPEKEMADLAETVIHFQAASQLVSQRLGMLRTVINEGRR